MRVYICVNTRYQITNLAPFVHLIAKGEFMDMIVNLTATRTQTSPAGDGGDGKIEHTAAKLTDQIHASGGPFFNAVIHELERRKLSTGMRVRQVKGPLKSPAYWREAMRQVFADLKASDGHEGIDVVYNYLGGPKEVMLGVIQTLEALKNDNRIAYRLVSYDMPAAVLMIDDRGRETVQPLDASENLVSFEGYLRVHGFVEMAPEEREQREREAILRKEATMEIAGAIFDSGKEKAKRRLRALARLTANDPASLASFDASFLALLLRVGRAAYPRQAHRLNKPEDLVRLEGLQYLKSGWLEEYVWLRMRESAPQGARVFLGAKLCRQDSADGFNDYELDVAVYCRNQLHALECKISTGQQRARRNMIDKAVVLKDELIGIGGRMVILHAFPFPDNSDLRDKARRSGVEMVDGPKPLKAFLDEFRPCVG